MLCHQGNKLTFLVQLVRMEFVWVSVLAETHGSAILGAPETVLTPNSCTPGGGMVGSKTAVSIPGACPRALQTGREDAQALLPTSHTSLEVQGP